MINLVITVNFTTTATATNEKQQQQHRHCLWHFFFAQQIPNIIPAQPTFASDILFYNEEFSQYD